MAGRRASLEERRAEKAAVDDPSAVLDAAARFLEARPRSVAEVRRRLRGAGYRAELVEGAVARLVELGILDDEAFARSWVESRDRARPRGEIALRRELGSKGIEREVVDAVLEERRDAAAVPGSPDDEAARRLVARHERALGRIDDPRVRRQRVYALLARSGFDPEVCARISATLAARGEQ